MELVGLGSRETGVTDVFVGKRIQEKYEWCKFDPGVDTHKLL